MFLCGEIYKNDDGRFQYVCCLCLTTLEQASQFELHVIMHHKNDRTKYLEPEIKIEEDTPEDLPIAFIDLQPPTQADINTTTVDLKIEQYTDLLDIVKEEPITDINYTKTGIPCDHCDLQLPCKGLKEIHSAQSHTEARAKSFSCELCTGTFDTREDYSKHEILHMNYVNPITCPHCNQLQCDMTQLNLHLNIQLSFKQSESKSKITRKRKQARPFECMTCKKTYRYETGSKKCELFHINKDETGTFECDICAKIFDSLTNFEIHIKYHYRRCMNQNRVREKESMQCDICQRVYKGYSNFLKHIQSHFYTFKCQFCDREYKSQSQKTAHEHVHRNEQHLCITCGRSFSLRRQLTAHIRKKHGDPDARYNCTVCQRVFTNKHNLNSHRKTHTAERSYSCKKCPKKFCTAKTLRQHAILHNGTKPFLCKYCGTGFAQNAGKRGHEKRVHETVK